MSLPLREEGSDGRVLAVALSLSFAGWIVTAMEGQARVDSRGSMRLLEKFIEQEVGRISDFTSSQRRGKQIR